jgi:putative sterol carrier protein
MTVTLPDQSDEWIRRWRERLNDNEDYAEATEGWGVGFDGDFCFEIQPDDAYDGDPIRFRVELEDGNCPSVDEVEENPDCGFALRAPYSAWKPLIRGEVDVMGAVMGGDFTVEGSKMKLLSYREAAAELGETAAAVDTEFTC